MALLILLVSSLPQSALELSSSGKCANGSNVRLPSAPSDTTDLSEAHPFGMLEDVAVDEAFEMEDCREYRLPLSSFGSLDIPSCSELSFFQDFQSSAGDSGRVKEGDRAEDAASDAVADSRGNLGKVDVSSPAWN